MSELMADHNEIGDNMDPVTGLVSGGLNFLGGLYAQEKTDERQEQSQAFNAQQAEINRAFQERMSSTAYQRSMEDMRKAGLNPILAYQKGGASSPTGSAASTTFTAAENLVGPAVSSAFQGMKMREEIGNMLATRKVTEAQEPQVIENTYKTKAEADNLREQNENLKAQRTQIGAQTSETLAKTANEIELLKHLQSQTPKLKVEQDMYDPSTYVGKAGYWTKMIGDIMKNLGLSGGASGEGGVGFGSGKARGGFRIGR